MQQHAKETLEANPNPNPALYLKARRGSAGRIAAEIGAAVDAGAPAAGLYMGATLMPHISIQHWIISYGTTNGYKAIRSTCNNMQQAKDDKFRSNMYRLDPRRTHTVRLAQDRHVVKASHNPAADVRLMQIGGNLIHRDQYGYRVAVAVQARQGCHLHSPAVCADDPPPPLV